MIVRDEHHQLEKCLQSIRPYVAHIAIVDTGSEDNSVEIAKKYADFVEVWTECNDPETKTPENPVGLMLRFDLARNRAFSHSTQPWTMWVDGDDEVVGAEHLEDLCKEYDRERHGNPSMAYMPYEYSRDHTGRVTMLHERERLVTPAQHFEWKGWVHEVCVPKGADMRRHTSRVKMVHHRDAGHKKMEPGRNLRILKAQYKALGDGDARHLYYLGMEHGNAGQIDDAIKFLTLYMERSGWDDEKVMAAQLVAKHYENRGEYEKAIEWGMKAILLREDWGESYFTVARNCYFMAQRGVNSFRWWQRAAYFGKVGLDKPPTQTTLFVNPLERDFEIHRYLNLALSRSGDTKGALDSVNKALQVRPDDEQFKLNKRVYEEYLATEDFKQQLNRLVSIGRITQGVRDFLETTQRDNKIPEPPKPIEPPKPAEPVVQLPDGKLDIVFFVGNAWEPWTPETAKLGGIGGSETAVIEMGRRFAAMGHKVRVYGDCTPRDGSKSLEYTFDGVSYLDWRKYRDLECDVLVTSRRPDAVDSNHNVKWKHSILWVHDVHCGDALTPARAVKLNRILTLSDWHRSYLMHKYPFLYPLQVQKTRNGIDLARFDKKVERNPHRAVYSSSPDRGMQTAIDIWANVRKKVPDAELHLYYGFKTWEAFADDGQRLTIAHLKRLIEANKDNGVTFHDRVPQDILAIEFLKSGVWCYPTWFSETSCITAMEAQAAGLRMVTSPIAALNETVGDRGALVAGDWLAEDFKGRFTEAVVHAMLQEGDEDRKDLQRYAGEHFGWDSLAKEWETMFIQGVNEAADIMLPEYQAAQ